MIDLLDVASKLTTKQLKEYNVYHSFLEVTMNTLVDTIINDLNEEHVEEYKRYKENTVNLICLKEKIDDRIREVEALIEKARQNIDDFSPSRLLPLKDISSNKRIREDIEKRKFVTNSIAFFVAMLAGSAAYVLIRGLMI